MRGYPLRGLPFPGVRCGLKAVGARPAPRAGEAPADEGRVRRRPGKFPLYLKPLGDATHNQPLKVAGPEFVSLVERGLL